MDDLGPVGSASQPELVTARRITALLLTPGLDWHGWSDRLTDAMVSAADPSPKLVAAAELGTALASLRSELDRIKVRATLAAQAQPPT